MGETPHFSGSDVGSTTTVAGFQVSLSSYRWSLFNNSWIIENTARPLNSWPCVLVPRPNHCLFGFHRGVYARTFHGMHSGGPSEHQKILREVGPAPPTSCLSDAYESVIGLEPNWLETSHEDRISPSQFFSRFSAVETTSEGGDLRSLCVFKASSDPWTPELSGSPGGPSRSIFTARNVDQVQCSEWNRVCF